MADRTTTTRLTVTIRRSDGSLVGDEPVVLTSTGKGNKFTPASGTTDKNGIFSATMASSIPEAKVVAATFDGVSVTTQVEFQRCQGALFLPTTSVPLGGTVGISTGDFNGDGTLDLATADTGSSLARVVLGKADGTFSAPVPYAVGANPGDMATGDFNSDGKPDLVSANYTAGTVSVLLAKADGTGFASAVNYAIGS
ncbi:MAG TPA: VCBS repeat-containing protein, partial [Polyangiaceae bacterium]|nr:VCBS repeat-containing protein [Polyangiaceae bacterium]